MVVIISLLCCKTDVQMVCNVVVIPGLQDPDSARRWYICGALADYGDAHAVIPLTEVVLNDLDSDVQYMAVVALENIGDQRALPGLRHVQFYDRGTDYEGRCTDATAAQAIAAIQTRV